MSDGFGPFCLFRFFIFLVIPFGFCLVVSWIGNLKVTKGICIHVA